MDSLSRIRGPVYRGEQAVFEGSVMPRPAEEPPAAPEDVAGVGEGPGTGLPTPWEEWDEGVSAAEGDEGQRRWLVASSGR